MIIKRLVIFSILSLLSLEANAIMCFQAGERVSGMNKICYYDCLGSEVAITVDSYKICPLSINKD